MPMFDSGHGEKWKALYRDLVLAFLEEVRISVERGEKCVGLEVAQDVARRARNDMNCYKTEQKKR